MNKLPVIAAIPNYNMGSNVGKLVKQLLMQDYEKIIVLDDASTDLSREVIEKIKDDRVIFSPTEINIGKGANRNRIIPFLDEESIIHFIDADMTLETENIPHIARNLFKQKNVGFIGGLVKDIDGIQFYYNYGPHINIKAVLTSMLHRKISRTAKNNKDKSIKLRKKYEKLLNDRVDVNANPIRKEVFWVSESNMLINSEIFKKFGGFDERLREHEILEFSIRTHSAGLKSWFDPSFSAIHNNLQVRPKGREIKRQKEFIKVIKISGPTKYFSAK
jgi:glycosyltransferase involved in cell wall biosynthesis